MTKGIYWIVRAPDGSYFHRSLSLYRSDSIDKFIEDADLLEKKLGGFSWDWKWYYRRGFRVVRVRFIEVNDDQTQT